MDSVSCSHLSDFVRTETAIIRKHLDEHSYLRHISEKTEALSSFINDYGWLMRELYCTKICEDSSTCTIARNLEQNGDLLCNRSRRNMEQAC